jgi:hypothetical protein
MLQEFDLIARISLVSAADFNIQIAACAQQNGNDQWVAWLDDTDFCTQQVPVLANRLPPDQSLCTDVWDIQGTDYTLFGCDANGINTPTLDILSEPPSRRDINRIRSNE